MSQTKHSSLASSETPGARLRAAVEAGPIQAPGAPNALAGRLIESLGFPATYLSGGAFSTSVLALPDIGLFTQTELAEHLRQLTARVSIPAIVDADTGFGGPVNVERTIQELESAGAAAIQLEDQELPKRCGHLSGKSLIDTDVMCAKLRAAEAARKDVATVIIARTDARGVDGLDAAIERAQRYIEAGADWIFAEALTTCEEFRQFASAIEVPLLANMTEFGKSPLLTFAELADAGCRAVIYPVTLQRVAMKAMQTALRAIQEAGTQEAMVGAMHTRQELYDLIGYSAYEQHDCEYFS